MKKLIEKRWIIPPKKPASKPADSKPADSKPASKPVSPPPPPPSGGSEIPPRFLKPREPEENNQEEITYDFFNKQTWISRVRSGFETIDRGSNFSGSNLQKEIVAAYSTIEDGIDLKTFTYKFLSNFNGTEKFCQFIEYMCGFCKSYDEMIAVLSKIIASLHNNFRSIRSGLRLYENHALIALEQAYSININGTPEIIQTFIDSDDEL